MWRQRQGGLCGFCRSRKPRFDFARHLAVYEQQWKNAVISLKTMPEPDLLRQMAAMCRRRLLRGGFLTVYSGVVAVPGRIPGKMSAAGHLARAVALKMGWEYSPILFFQRPTRPQHGLPRRQRLLNLRRSMVVKNKIRLSGSYLVVDDVMTTAATANECARALKTGGASRVDVLTLARGAWGLGHPGA